MTKLLKSHRGRHVLQRGEEVTLHRVSAGDTLSALAARYYGAATRWQPIWIANREAMLAEQERRFGPSRPSHRGPDWIFPGMVLLIPELGENR